jgi:hypothetical protein
MYEFQMNILCQTYLKQDHFSLVAESRPQPKGSNLSSRTFWTRGAKKIFGVQNTKYGFKRLSSNC